MTENEIGLTMLRGTIAGFPQDDQDKINGYAADIRNILIFAKASDDETYAQLAISLAGLEVVVACE